MSDLTFYALVVLLFILWLLIIFWTVFVIRICLKDTPYSLPWPLQD